MIKVTVFNENTFESVESIYEDEDLPNFKVTKEFNLNEVNKKLGVDKFIINDIVKNDTGHVEKIIVDNDRNKTFPLCYLAKITRIALQRW